jgi:hypothetical protein
MEGNEEWQGERLYVFAHWQIAVVVLQLPHLLEHFHNLSEDAQTKPWCCATRMQLVVLTQSLQTLSLLQIDVRLAWTIVTVPIALIRIFTSGYRCFSNRSGPCRWSPPRLTAL